MPDEVTSTDAIAERDGEEEARSSIVASETAPPEGINFHVTMTRWTQDDMEDLIVEAAARLVLGKLSDNRLAKLIEEKVLAEIVKRADAKISEIAEDVMGHALVPVSWSQKPTVTIGETLAHLSRAYLEQIVDAEGKVSTDNYSYASREKLKRIDFLVRAAFDQKLGQEIAKATKDASNEAAKEVRAKYAEIVTAETSKLRAAISAAIEGK